MQYEQVVEKLRRLQEGDTPSRGGQTLAYVYDSGIDDLDQIAGAALTMFRDSNGLDPTAFPSLIAMEKDLILLATRLLQGPADTAGTVTSGGTESILLAVQAARDAKPQIKDPVMIVPSTVHAAFAKAAHYFGVEKITVDVDSSTRKAQPAQMHAALNQYADRAVLMAASAPSYAHGVVDPIDDLGQLAEHASVRFHVDACIGGWILPWASQAGIQLPPWDFTVDGVTSVSVDLHKYAYTPKGAAVLLHRNAALRRSQYFAYADWPGYTMLNSTMQSTKSGGPVAAAWAVVQAIGEDGYAKLAHTVLTHTQRLATALGERHHIRLAAMPESSLVAIECDDSCDVFTIADQMAQRGWLVQPQMSYLDMPSSLHLSVSAATDVDALMIAFDESLAAAIQAGPVSMPPALRQAMGGLESAQLDDATFNSLLELAGLTPKEGSQPEAGRPNFSLPTSMAPINALLDQASPQLRETLLTYFLDYLTR